MTQFRDLSIPATEGAFARQAHVDPPAGSFEREVGRDGFLGAATHFYHKQPPTNFESIEGNIRPRAFNPTLMSHRANSPWDAIELFHNSNFKFRFWRPEGDMSDLVRNADGDDLLFVHRGNGDIFCDYGHIEYRTGDYVLFPRGTMWRLEPRSETELFLIEATGSAFKMPNWGGVGRHAPVDFGAFVRPTIDEAFVEQQGQGKWRVRVKRQNAIGTIAFGHNPLDALGWKGDLYPVRLNLDDIRPLMSHKAHLPPSAFTTFVGNRFVVCSFVPRPLETDPRAMKLPFFHDNSDFDEILLSYRGAVSSRGSALGEGGITYHPMGFTHGPHPGALTRMFDPLLTESVGYAVMLDARDPIEVSTLSSDCEIKDYANSWQSDDA